MKAFIAAFILVTLSCSIGWSRYSSDSVSGLERRGSVGFSGPRGLDFPIDCPTCTMPTTSKKKGQCGGSSPKKANDGSQSSLKDPEELWKHVEAIREQVFDRNERARDFARSLMSEENKKNILCLWKNESMLNMRAVACGSSAGGIGQVVKATGEAVQKKQGNPCKGVDEVKWMSKTYMQSSRAQVFLSLCVLFDKNNGGTITDQTFKSYYGADSNNAEHMRVNGGNTQKDYLRKMKTCVAQGGYLSTKNKSERGS